MSNVLYRYFPLGIFLLVWFSVFWLHNQSLYNIREVQNQAYSLLALAIFSLSAGYILFSLYDRQYSHSNSHSLIVRIKNEKMLLVLIFSLISIQLFGSFIIFYEITYQLGGIDIFLNQPLAVRQFVVGVQNGYEEVRIFYKLGNYLTNIGFLSCFFGGIYFSSFSNYRSLGLLPILSLLVSQLLTLGRYKFVSGLVFFIVAYLIFSYFLKPSERRKRIFELFIIGIISTLFVGIISYYVLKFRSPLELDITYLLKKSLYLYFTGGVTAFDSFLNSDFVYTYGESSFRSVTKWLEKVNLWEENSVRTVHNPFTNVTPTYSMNTYTFSKSLYEDFGYLGLIFIPFIWGALTYKLCINTLLNFSFVNVYLISILTFSLFISFFSFYFQSLTTLVFWFIFMFLIQKLFFNQIIDIQHNRIESN